MLISLLWYSAIGHVGMVQGCSGQVQTGLKKHFFSKKVFKHQNWLPREVLDALSLVSV